jgi:crotonobetaine/carnitine-CoA ligase
MVSESIPYEDSVPVPERTVGGLLRRSARVAAQQLAIVEPRGRSLTYAELLNESERAGAALRGIGLEPGQHVLALLDTPADNVATWLGANLAGVVWVPVNTAFKGVVLRDIIEHSRARVMIIEDKWLDRLSQIAHCLTRLETVIVRGGSHDGGAPGGLARLEFAELQAVEPVDLGERAVSDISTIIYTSGTEGAAKGVLVPHGHVYQCSFSHVRPDDTPPVVMVVLQIFHSAGLMTAVFQAIRTHGTAVLHGEFSATRFWDDVRRHGCTTVLLAGPMAAILLRQPPSPDDRNHALQTAIMFPCIPETAEFAARFGVLVGAGYGQSEMPAPLLAPPGEGRPGLCGAPTPMFEIQLVDGSDLPVPPGEVGELLVRPREPWLMNLGYFDAPVATVAAWRNFWWHTGDLLRLHESGQYEFVDRRKDVIRRRGENVSSLEVERILLQHEQVSEAAVVAVASEVAEDEIKAVITLSEGAEFDPVAILRHVYDRLPYFMVPRFIQVVEQLPKTQTLRVQKQALRVSDGTMQVWDCEVHGFRITRHELIEPAGSRPPASGLEAM